MSPLKTGDRIRVANREVTAADVKSGLFYDYFRNLTGSVERVYEDKTICVRVDFDSLPQDVQKRHLEVQDAVKRRWLNGMGQEQRERLPEAQRTVTLNYSILVSESDLGQVGKGKPAPRPKAEPQPPQPAAQARPRPAAKTGEEQQTSRRSEEDIAKAEEEYLKSRIKDGKKRQAG